ncbi:MAG TPA: helicase HerA-like domain-containing protein [Solirubrobacteraceae bacterium]|nr:helicase HerA-like domain-containing protein [Solirubrobacteraceae bacterium]
MTTTTRLALGFAIGLIVAREMRRLRLRWTWAATALVFVVCVRSDLGGQVWTPGIAAFFATVRGRRWHREDVEAGADLAEIAARRRGPLEALLSLARKLDLRRGGLAPDGLLHGDRLIVGREENGEPVSIPLGDSRGGRHTLVVGATGSGKTVTATWIATRAIAGGMGVVAIDPKGDGRMRAELARSAQACGRPFIPWTPDGPSVYNPYTRGEATEIADKALAGERFTEPHYQRQAQRYLGYEVRALRGVGLEVSLKALVEYLDPARLEVLARSLPEERAAATHEYLDSLTSRQQSDLSGVRDRLSIMAESDFAAWLDPRTPGAEPFNLIEAVRERAVVYFDLQADSRPLLAQMLGVAIVIDLQTTVAALQGRPTPTLAIIDEFSAIAAEQVTRLFGRARSAGVSLLLGTQEFSDLRLAGREMVLEQVLGNLSSLIAHRQIVPDSADLVARLAGSRGVWKTSHSSDGRWTRTRASAPLIRAELVRYLPDGCAAVIELSGHSTVRVARMFSPASSRVTGSSLAARLGARVSRAIASARAHDR